jgi:hypothetical protein
LPSRVTLVVCDVGVREEAERLVHDTLAGRDASICW